MPEGRITAQAVRLGTDIPGQRPFAVLVLVAGGTNMNSSDGGDALKTAVVYGPAPGN